MPTVEAKVEDVEDSEEDLPDLEPAKQNAAQQPAAKQEQAAKATSGKFSRSEKKSRKAVQRLGMKPFPGVVSVRVKKAKGVCDYYRSFVSKQVLTQISKICLL